MSRIIDLSYEISDSSPVFPGDPEVEIKKTSSSEETGYNVTKIIMGSHTGTHVDVPRHISDIGAAVDEIPVGRFFGEALLIDVAHLQGEAHMEISVDHLKPFENEISSIVVFRTGWSASYGSLEFFMSFPGIGIEAAKWLAEKGVGMIGIDMPSVHPEKHKEVHEILLSNGIIIVESLANLERLSPGRFDFFAVPLRIKGLDGSPVRAFAVER